MRCPYVLCAYCRSAGRLPGSDTWQPMTEADIPENYRTWISHGVCPDCLPALWAECEGEGEEDGKEPMDQA